jgi:serine/threonine protein kinase
MSTTSKVRELLRGGRPSGAPQPLGEIACSRGWLTDARLEEALEEQRRASPRPLLGEILRRRGWLTAEQLLRALLAQKKDAPAPLPEGAKIGRWTLVRELGRGGMGVVYEARDGETRAALKVLREDAADPASVERLRREAELVGRLAHPSIVPIREVGSTRPGMGVARPYLVMDLIEGRTLQEAISGGVPRAELLRMLETIAGAVAHAHAQGVVHRDLKPTNILVDRAGKVYLSDFGIARAADWTTRITPSDALLGTIEYIAPEQVMGPDDRSGPAADLYALGVILYVVLAGRTPFSAGTPAALLRRILWDQPSPIEPSPGPDLEAVVRKAMEKAPERRYASAADFAEELARIREGKPARAREIGSLAGIFRRPKP